MAKNFPNSPADGDIYEDHQWSATDQTWYSIANLGSLPCGAIIPWVSTVVPAGWLLCDGAAVSRTTYSSLFAALGGIASPWGLGNGTTTFNTPNLQGKTLVGKNGATFANIAQTGGAETVTLDVSQMPSHTHIQDSHNHSQNSHDHGGWHRNTAYYASTNVNNWPAVAMLDPWTYGNNVGGGATASNNPATATNQYTGGGQAHNNLQPYVVVNYIIKTTVMVMPQDSELAVRMGQAESTVNGYSTRIAALEQPGRVLQVQTAVLTSRNGQSLGAQSDGSAFLSVAITPRSTSSKIIVRFDAMGSCASSGAYGIFAVSTYRNGTKIGLGNAENIATRATSAVFVDSTDSAVTVALSGTVIDSPSTTSAVTYDIRPTNVAAETRTYYVNGPARNDAWASRTISTLTVWEIAQ